MENYDCLKLANQLCFPLYAASKEIIRKYKPFLDKYDLTYTQYLVMMVMWEKQEINVKELGDCLFLDSGTLTPVLKKLETKNYISRSRSKQDERNLIIHISETGENLKKELINIPLMVGNCINLEETEAAELYRILYKILNQVGDKK